MNSFEKHGITHIHASLINSWVDQPALTLLKIAGIDNGEAGPAAWRGTSAEHAMNLAAEASDTKLTLPTLSDLVTAAQTKFDEIHEDISFIKENLFNPNEGLWAETKQNSQFRENTTMWRTIIGGGLIALIGDMFWDMFSN